MLIGWNNKSGKNLLNSMIIPAVTVNQAAATTGADLMYLVPKILNIFLNKYLRISFSEDHLE